MGCCEECGRFIVRFCVGRWCKHCARLDVKRAKIEQVVLAEREKQMIERERQRTAQDLMTIEKGKQKAVNEREAGRRAIINEQWTDDLNAEDSRRNTIRYLQSCDFTFEQILEYLRVLKKADLK
ncbi:hypothetical protein EMCRGX_G032196 [Ephydatia muelleri]